MVTENNLFTLAATARRLRVKPDWLKLEAEQGRLPGIKAGDGWLFHGPTIIKLLEERAIRETARPAKGAAHAQR